MEGPPVSNSSSILSTTTTTTTTTTTIRPTTTTTTTTTLPTTTTTWPTTTSIVTTTQQSRTTTGHPTTVSTIPVTSKSITSSLSTPILSSLTSTSGTVSASAIGPIPTTTVTDSSSGFPKVAVIGVSVAGVIIVGFVTIVLFMKHKQRHRAHKALTQDDLFDHLPVEPSPTPFMSMPGHHYSHHKDHDNVHDHELEPMYHNGGEYNHMHHHGGDIHHDHHYHHDQNHHHHHDPSQNHAHDNNPGQDPGQQNMHQNHPGLDQGGDGQQGFQSNGQGVQGNGQGFQGNGQGFQGNGQGFQGNGHGFQGANGQGLQGNGQGFQGGSHGTGSHVTQPTSTPGGGGVGHQGPGAPSQQIGGGGGHQAPISHGVPGSNSDLPISPIPPPLVNRPASRMRPDSSNQYSMLVPASPTISSFSGEGGLVDDTSIPAQGTMTIAPLPLNYSNSIGSSVSSWEDRSQDLGYSPRSKQALLNQARLYDTNSSQHNSGRVFPSTNVATIPVPQAPEVRAPQDASQTDAIGSFVSTGNVSSLNTFDRRHPQSHDTSQGSDSLFDFSSEPSSRNPQNR
ncbi:hypothetical protein BGZ46_000689 [Entomortierella lignicola]|nr:hypothetical protein BGZ46_000689 [Entomortierella lignicola]